MQTRLQAQYKPGDHVQYHTVGSGQVHPEHKATGVIKSIVTHDERSEELARPHTVHADPDHPKYLILNDHTGKESAYSEASIIRKLEE